MELNGTAISPLLHECAAHMHPCWEIILNIRGKGVETVGSRQHAFYPGSSWSTKWRKT